MFWRNKRKIDLSRVSSDTILDALRKSPLRLFPSIALRNPTAHNFTRDRGARIKSSVAAFSLQLELAKEVNRHFLENERGDLSFFSVVLN